VAQLVAQQTVCCYPPQIQEQQQATEQIRQTDQQGLRLVEKSWLYGGAVAQ